MKRYRVKMKKGSMVGVALVELEASDDAWKLDGRDGWEVVEVEEIR